MNNRPFCSIADNIFNIELLTIYNLTVLLRNMHSIEFINKILNWLKIIYIFLIYQNGFSLSISKILKIVYSPTCIILKRDTTVKNNLT